MISSINDIEYLVIDFNDIEYLVKEYNLHLELDVENKTVTIPTYRDTWDLLNVLDDALLLSEVTKNKYEAILKKEK